MTLRLSPRRGTRGFTLIELIVVILVLGILATLAVVGYSSYTARAQRVAAEANLAQIATAALAHHTLLGLPELTRAGVVESLADASVTVTDTVDPGNTGARAWQLLGTAQAPQVEGDYALGFDRGENTAANDLGGTRAAVVTTTASGEDFARILIYGNEQVPSPERDKTGQVPSGTTPTQVLDDPSLIAETGGSGGGTPVDPGDGEDFGTLSALMTVQSDVDSETGDRWEWASVDYIIAPAGTSTSTDPDAGIRIACTVDVPLTGPVSGAGYFDGGGYYAYWGPEDPTAAAGRTYTCVIEARNDSGTVLARRTLVATDGGPAAGEDARQGAPAIAAPVLEPGNASITASWVAPAGATMSSVEFFANGSSAGSCYPTGVELECTLSFLTNGQEYEAEVVAGLSSNVYTVSEARSPRASATPSTFAAFAVRTLTASSSPNGQAQSVDTDGTTTVVWDEANDDIVIYTKQSTSWAKTAELPVGWTGLSGARGQIQVSGDTVMLGVNDGNDGKLFVWRRVSGTWSQTQVIDRPGTVTSFAERVELEGDYAYVSHEDPLVEGWGQGIVRIYTKSGSTWSQVDPLRDVVRMIIEVPRFGSSIAVDGDTLVVTAPGHAPTNTQDKVFIFSRTGGTEWDTQQIITSPSTMSNTGASVAVDGDTLAVTWPGTNEVTIYTRTGATWTERTTLTNPAPSAWDGSHSGAFGEALALDGNKLLIGEPARRVTDSSSFFDGRVSVFTGSGASWTGQAVQFDDRNPTEAWGGMLSAENGVAVVGGSPYAAGRTANGDFPWPRTMRLP